MFRRIKILRKIYYPILEKNEHAKRRAKEGPRNEWMNDVTNDLEELRMEYWKHRARNRKEWSIIVNDLNNR